MADLLRPLPPNYRRNMLSLMGDWTGFGVALSFISATTVMPALVNRLTGSPLAVGLISTIGTGGWLLPQLIAAGPVSRLRHKKRAVILPSLIGRPTFIITALAILWFAVDRPGLALAVFFVGYGLFSLCDGVASVPWFDLFSRAIPPHRRGRFIATTQIVSAFLTMGVGGVVGYILGDAGPFRFPANYAALFFLAGGFSFLSLASFSRVRETPSDVVESRLSVRDYLGELKVVWTGDRDFRLITAVRLTLGLTSLASPFYAVYALNVKGVSTGAIGWFLSAQIAGGLLCSLVLGYFLERHGSRLTTNLEAILALVAPLLAIVTGLLLPGDSPWFVPTYLLVFAFVGALNNSFMLGHMNYVLEMSPEDRRPVYVGLSNTLAGLLVVVPLVGGWLVNVLSYEPLFVLTVVCVSPTLLLTTRLTEPRHRVAAAAVPVDPPTPGSPAA